MRNLLGIVVIFLTLFLMSVALGALGLKGYALVGFVFVGVGILALPPFWSASLLLIYLSVEGMLKLISDYHPVIHVGFDLLVITIASRWVIRLAFGLEKFPTRLPPLGTLLFFHVAWLLIELFNPYSIGLIPSIAGMKLYTTFIVVYLLGLSLAQDRDTIRHFVRLWVLIGVVQSVVALYQSWIGPSSVLWISPMYAKMLVKYHGYAFRPFGTTNLPGAPSLFAYTAVPLLLLLLFSARKFKWKPVAAAALPLLGLTLVMCQIRSTIAKAIVSIVFFIGLAAIRMPAKIRMRIVATTVSVAALLALALPSLTDHWIGANEENSMAVGRSLSLFDWNTAKEARSGAADRIISAAITVPFGAGFSHAGAAAGAFLDIINKDPYFPGGFFTDNLWALAIAEIGLPGALFLTLLLGAILWRGALGIHSIRDPELNITNAAIMAALIGIIVGLWGSEGLLYNPEATFFWFFAGILVGLPQAEQSLATATGKVSHA